MTLSLHDIGEHLDIAESTASEMCTRLAVDRDAWTLDEVRVAYIRALREAAAGRGDARLAEERALLAREQRHRVAMQNARMRGELAPTDLLTSALASVGRAIVSRLEQLPQKLTRLGLPPAAVEEIETVVAAARCEIAEMAINLETESTPSVGHSEDQPRD